MSHPAHAGARECRDCGARLVAWHCGGCGASTIELVANAYIAELASAWRPPVESRIVHDRPALSFAA